MAKSVYHPRYVALQAHLKALRVDAGLTQVEIATAMKVTQSDVSKVERGERYVDILYYLDWCRACGISPKKAVVALEQAGA